MTQLESKMQTLEAERDQLHEFMTRAVASTELADKGKQLKRIDEELPVLESRWLELTGLLENASTSS